MNISKGAWILHVVWASGCLVGVPACTDAGVASGADEHGHGPDAAHPEDEDEPTVAVTVWDQGHELFVEYPPPVAGRPVQFVTHVSRTDTGAPRREGPVTFHLSPAQGSPVAHEEPAPARDGIYLPQLTFPSTGTWTVSLEIPTAEGGVTLALPPTTVYADAEQAHHAEVPEEVEGVTYLKEQQWRLGTRTGPVQRRVLTAKVRVPGVVKVLPGREARLTPPVAGVLLPATGIDRLPELGQAVERGDLLAMVRPPFSDYLVQLQQARAEIPRREVALARARRILERTEKLYEENARSEREREEATFAVRLAEADLDGARSVLASMEASGLTPDENLQFELRAPIRGHVHHLDATLGERIEPGDSVLEILDPSRVLVEARPRIDQLKEVTDLKRPTFVHLQASFGEDAALPAGEVRLLTTGDTVDPQTRTVALAYEVANDDLVLRLGQALDVLLPAGAAECLAVPVRALVDEGGETTVYLQVSGETFERRPVRTGIHSEGMVEIVDGLAEGERVVIEGAYAIRLQSAAGSVPAHHHH